MTTSSADFSSNRFSTVADAYQVSLAICHPEFRFDDGNLCIMAGRQYFIVHQGLLSRHSEVLSQRIKELASDGPRLVEGRTVMTVDDDPDDLAYFLRALYGMSYNLVASSFHISVALLRLSTKYKVVALREATLRGLAVCWPKTLSMWEMREKNVTDPNGMYIPRPTLPHPILIIELAREVDAPELLPSAFYDLSRYLPSQIMCGTTSGDGSLRTLSDEDLTRVLRGKEQAARFLSTFIVSHLEGRAPSQFCANRADGASRKRACHLAFEAVTFEVIRDINGMVCNRNTDPLFCIADSFLMQTRHDSPGVENKAVYRACEECRMEYGALVAAVREDFWRAIPQWFEVEIKGWGV